MNINEKPNLNMEKHQNYFEHPGRVIEKDSQFSHVMAITLDPTSGNKDGVIRCITSRTGDVAVSGLLTAVNCTEFLASRSSISRSVTGSKLKMRKK
jgi:hypothetical protein